jgi:hypothetical protein
MIGCFGLQRWWRRDGDRFPEGAIGGWYGRLGDMLGLGVWCTNTFR